MMQQSRGDLGRPCESKYAGEPTIVRVLQAQTHAGQEARYAGRPCELAWLAFIGVARAPLITSQRMIRISPMASTVNRLAMRA